MTLTKEIKKHYEYGDILKISIFSKNNGTYYSTNTIGKVIREGKGSRKVVEVIENYYKSINLIA